MHKHKVAGQCAAGDEVFEASDSESEGEESGCESVDSDTPTAASPVRSTQQQDVPDENMPDKIVPLPLAQASASAAATRCCGAAAAAVTRSPSLQGSGEAQSGAGLMGLVSHLRNDNARLREALVQAQRDLEAKAAEGSKESSIDFGHLLSLVKDFGDDLGYLGSFYGDDCNEANQSACKVEVFAISSPRGDDDDCRKVCESQSLPSDEVPLLRKKLQTCRQEVEQLHRELAAKDAELLELRKNAVGVA